MRKNHRKPQEDDAHEREVPLGVVFGRCLSERSSRKHNLNPTTTANDGRSI